MRYNKANFSLEMVGNQVNLYTAIKDFTESMPFPDGKARSVFRELGDYATDNCFDADSKTVVVRASYNQLAQRMLLSESTIKRAIKALVDADLISVVSGRSRFDVNTYTLKLENAFSAVIQNVTPINHAILGFDLAALRSTADRDLIAFCQSITAAGLSNYIHQMSDSVLRMTSLYAVTQELGEEYRYTPTAETPLQLVN